MMGKSRTLQCKYSRHDAIVAAACTRFVAGGRDVGRLRRSKSAGFAAVLLFCAAPLLIAAEPYAIAEPDDAISAAELEDLLSGFDDPDLPVPGDVPQPPASRESLAEEELDEVMSGFDSEDSNMDSAALDEVLAGFDTPDAAADKGDAPPSAPSTATAALPAGLPAPVNPFSPDHFTGSISSSVVYAYVNRDPAPRSTTDFEGITRLRVRLDLEYQADPSPGWRLHADGHAWHDAVYQLIDRNYPASVKDEYQREIELDEMWLRGRLGSAADIKMGRQIVVWGKSDNLRITDVLNPLDAREPGMVDIEDLRLPVTMTRLDLYRGNWNLSALVIHEVRFDKLPPFGSEYFPLPRPLPPDDQPDSALRNSQFGLALNGSFSRWDMSLYAASIYDRQAWIAHPGTRRVERRHARISMLGAAAVLPLGNWLWKTELAHYPGLRLTGHQDRVARSDALLGVEYSGFNDTTLSVELADRHLYNYHSLPGAAPRNTWQAALRYQGDFQHDRLHMTVVGVFVELFDSAAGFIRGQGEYELTDDINLTIGLVLYQQGERPPSRGVGDNDRVFADLEWSF